MNTNDGLRALIGEDIAKALEDSKVEGRTLGKYRIGSELGEGGMGAVYLAKDLSLSRTVVIKVIKFPSQDPEHRKMMVKRFQREAQAACQVLHPNVAVTFAFDEVDGRHLLVMERIDGRTLREALTRADGTRAALPPKKAVEIVIGILRGLEAIHAAKIVHRDLKPGNVMLTHKDDQVKILDFGLGKPTEALGEAALDMTLTQHGIAVGSPMYMSPEQTLSLPVDARADIYAVGIILFQMLTGKPPFSGRDPLQTYEMHRRAPVPPIVAPGDAQVPEALKAVVRKAMAKAPEGRYATAAQMRAALEAVDFAAKPPVAVKPRPSIRPWSLALLACCASLALAVGLVLTMGAPAAPADGSEAVIPTAKAPKAAQAKTAPVAKASDGIEIPPPPPVAVATSVQGCELYVQGRTGEAIATLTRALASKPDDAEGLYCLCGAYVRQPESAVDARKACEAYRARPDRDANKTRQVDLWLRRVRR